MSDLLRVFAFVLCGFGVGWCAHAIRILRHADAEMKRQDYLDADTETKIAILAVLRRFIRKS